MLSALTTPLTRYANPDGHRCLETDSFSFFFLQDPEYILIKRWVPEHEQDFLWEHTRELRERRRAVTQTTNTTVLQIEQGGHNHHHHGEVQYEFVKKKERKRDKSPGLITFLAGGKR